MEVKNPGNKKVVDHSGSCIDEITYLKVVFFH